MINKKLFAFSRPVTKFLDMDFAFPINVYTKDFNSRFSAVNTHQLQHANALLQINTEDICGVSMEELFHGLPNIYGRIISNDKKILKEERSYFFVEEVAAGIIKDNMFSIKTTACDSANRIAEIFGISFYLNRASISSITNAINELQLFANAPNNPGLLIVNTKLEILNILSPREKECAIYLTRGMSYKEIGKAMAISNRTVECHIDHIKAKLNCNTKSQIIAKIFDYAPTGS